MTPFSLVFQRYLVVALFTLLTIAFYLVGDAVNTMLFPRYSSDAKAKKQK